VLPAYDEALKVIEADSRALKKELGELQAKINELEGKPENAEELAQLKDKARIVEIQSEINLPWTRWQVSNALGLLLSSLRILSISWQLIADMSKPVHRHLVEQRWREEGDLDLLVCLGWNFHDSCINKCIDGTASPDVRYS
jgi:large subunit ribosomal protein L35